MFTCTVGEYSTLDLTIFHNKRLHIYHCRMEVVLAALVISIYTDVHMFYTARFFILVNFRCKASSGVWFKIIVLQNANPNAGSILARRKSLHVECIILAVKSLM